MWVFSGFLLTKRRMTDFQDMEKFNEEAASVLKKHSQCLRWTEKASGSPLITFLSSELVRGHGSPPSLICQPCDPSRAGGFIPSTNSVILCENQIESKTHLQDVLAHEMVHAYDTHTTTLDWKNESHIACTELRAVSLSGECKLTREIQRGYVGFAKHYQECVRRRAVLGVMQATGLGQIEAGRRVMSVWGPCFNDTAPFDEIF